MVYAYLGTEQEVCDHGVTHHVAFYAVKRITDTGQTALQDNGYEKHEWPVYVDAQGRTYSMRVEVDYSNNVHFVRTDGRNFWPRPLSFGMSDVDRSFDGRLLR